jgi:hypothetical protein
MALRALPHSSRVPEQRLLSLKISQWRQQSCGTSSQKTPTDLGFSIPRLYIGKEVLSEVNQGHLTMWRCGPGARHPMVSLPSGSLPALVRSSSFI